MAKSDYLEAAILNNIFRGASYPVTGAVYVGLSTADPLDDATGLAEPSGGAYVRVALGTGQFSTAATGGSITNSGAAIAFPSNTASWGTITHFAVFDAASSGNMLYHGPLQSSIDMSTTGQVFQFAVNNMTVTES